MRVKTKYRQQFKDGGRVEESDAAIQPPVAAAVALPPDTPPIPATPQPPLQPKETPQDSTHALKAQLEGLKQSEALQRQQQEITNTHNRRSEWVKATPLAQKFYDRLDAFHVEAMDAGMPDMGQAYISHMENRLLQLQAQNPSPESQAPTPPFFAPPAKKPSPRLPEAPRSSSIVSAPVSRDIPNASGKRTNGKVTLTPQEVEAARIANISVEEYAAQKQKYEGMKDSGEYRDGRENR